MPRNRFSPGELIPGTRFWRDLVRVARSRTIKTVPPLYRTVKRFGTDLIWGPPAGFPGVIIGGTYNPGPTDPPYIVAEARFDPAAMTWSQIPGGRVVTAYEYNSNNLGIGGGGVGIGSAVWCGLTIAGDWRFNFVAASPRYCGEQLCIHVVFTGFYGIGNPPKVGDLKVYYLGTLVATITPVLILSGPTKTFTACVSLAGLVPIGGVVNVVYHMYKLDTAYLPTYVYLDSSYADQLANVTMPCAGADVTLNDPRPSRPWDY